MFAVSTYQGILEYLNRKDNRPHWVPILLIRPDTILRLLRERASLANTFSYYDYRTGPRHFFLPGYISQYNSIEALHNNQQESCFLPAFSMTRLNQISYSDRAFVGFINDLEARMPSFRYIGDAELLFLFYDPDGNHGFGDFDFDMHKYSYDDLRLNLSDFNDQSWREFNRFIEWTISKLKQDDENIKTIFQIQDKYRMLCPRYETIRNLHIDHRGGSWDNLF